MMQEIHRGISPCTMTVEEIMRGNFVTSWPNSDAVVLQVDSRDGAAMNWKQMLAVVQDVGSWKCTEDAAC